MSACSFEFAWETRSSEDSVIVFRSMNPVGDCSSPLRTEPSQILSCCFSSPLVRFQVYWENKSVLLSRGFRRQVSVSDIVSDAFRVSIERIPVCPSTPGLQPDQVALSQFDICDFSCPERLSS